RLLIGTLAWIIATIAVAGWGLSSLFGQHLSRQFQAELATHLDQLAAMLAFDAQGRPTVTGELSDPRLRRPYGGLYWQVEPAGAADGQRLLLRSRSLWDAVLDTPPGTPMGIAADGRLHEHRIEGPNGKPLRMIERVIRSAEYPQDGWRLVVAADEALLTAPLGRFNTQPLMALSFLARVLPAALVTLLLVGLRPLVGLQRSLARVREGLAVSIAGRFPSEIQPLVDDFNGVLARNADVVARARPQAGNLGH